jgi:HD-like signal output (HDOD) protein
MYRWLQRLFSGPAQAGADASVSPDARPAPPAPGVAHAPAVTRPPASTRAPAATQAPAASLAGAPVARPAVPFDQLDLVNRLYYHWLFDTEGESEFDTSAPETQVLDALAAILNSQQSGSALVRRLPGMIPQLLQSLRSDSFSGAQLSRTISNDVVLVAAVIRVANSSLNGNGAITSVEHAVMLIGQEGLRHLITSVAFRPIIDMNSGHFTRTLAPRIWDHSERCAVANRALAESMGIDPFEAFLAGLVQNVGLIVSLRIMDQMAKGNKNLGSEMFCAGLVRDARILTCSIGREWNFPESVITAIGEQAGMKKGAVISPLGRLLTLTDYMGKVRILVENDRAPFGDPALFGGLPPSAAEAYRSLQAIDAAALAPAADAGGAP